MTDNIFTGYKEGDKVVEKDYGIGTVVMIDTDKVVVNFDRRTVDRPGGVVRLSLPFERLRPATGPEVQKDEAKRLLELVRAEGLGDMLNKLIFECAGAATRPLLEDHPDYEFPSQRVMEAVDFVLADWGFGAAANQSGSHNDSSEN